MQDNQTEKDLHPNEKYGLVELVKGKYFDKELKQNLTLALNYVEASGDEFKKQFVAMVMYRYEGGANRTETAEAFAEYAEENLDLLEAFDDQEKESNDDAIEAESKVIENDPS